MGSQHTTARPRWRKHLLKRRHPVVFLVVGLFASSALVAGQDSPRPRLDSFEVTPLASYRSSMRLAIQPTGQGTNPHVTLDENSSYGFSVGMRIRDDDVVDFRWTRQDSYSQVQDGTGAFPQIRVTLNQFHCDFSREYVLKHPMPWARPYIIGSVGATNISDGVSSWSTHLSIGIGGGVKFFVAQHIGFRIQAEWLPILVNPQGSASCGVGCVAHLSATVASQAEVAVGPVIRF